MTTNNKLSKNKSPKQTLVLLDSHAILHRAYHALPDFTSSRGEPTGALYGLSTVLMKIIKDLKPDYIVAAFDLPKPTYRHEIYDDYKKGRAKTDDALVEQIKRSRDVFSAFSIPIYDKEGFEADDILGTIVEEMKERKDIDIVIASGDMDTLQLVSGTKVRVYTLKKGIKDTIIYDEESVFERFGFKPKLLTDYKGLRGDPSDNIIGIKGIGEKTATILISQFGTIENLFKEIKKNKESFKKIGITDRVLNLLIENEEEALFSKELATIRKDAPIDFVLPPKKWSDSVNTEKIFELFDELTFRTLKEKVSDVFGVKTNNLTRQMSFNESGVESVPEEEIIKIGLGLWLLDSTISNPTLDDILRYAKTKDFNLAKKKIIEEIKKQGLLYVYEDIELPLVPILNKMSEDGVLIDVEYLKNLSKEYRKILEKIEKKIWERAGVEFNINSPKQLGEALYDKMGISTSGVKKTSTGARSTRESELEKLQEANPIIGDILEYRELQKLLSTYIDAIPTQIGEDGRLHPTFVQTGTTTGRIASQNPNVQNIPIRTELGRKIRNTFVAEKGYKIVAIDYSQVELRIAAMLSGDEKLLDIFRRGEDIHTAVASEVFGVSAKDVDKSMRFHAKTINFGILYGMGVNSLKKSLGSTQKEARDFYDKYFERFVGLKKYIDDVKNKTAKDGFTTTFFGRKRFFEGIRSSIPFVRASAERMAINAPIQGTQADLVKLAMIRIDEFIKKQKLDKEVRMLLQVHDELVFEIKENKVKEVSPKIKEIMETIIDKEDTHGITFVADVSVGENWGEMRPPTLKQ
ncbi:hypothetical protein COW81_02735 [Candidatus Campbellbacteria bacterium CG22_combo_CG10-13_8_21_14_all_36_13]|uniref:DNA-directed DNA polymerase n=1 Tax=Candidatus Campbellbacteria bacterium CG22_combo_CG10-13_8_21_14_all_36_13 TaxID=1974529 RepID=A0A2H0DXS6_9BACT|nr:MAG: hypothetical protein COW81_02735 [Candidatus Campbellbacteria bacterium CG22_combo_CG10-13_8_21_14_all_36_13]